ncbi:MAG: hypothetical protein LBU14_04510 [Candidatus Peribacteria bacterium]|nr:hypothetical protein [Candidatus Peribacteria bacterium]
MSKFIRNIIKKIKYLIKNWNNTYTIILFFIIVFLVIIKTLFEYTVFDYEYYTTLADQQQIGKVIVPVNRGTIYS